VHCFLPASCWFPAWITWRWHVPPNHGLTFSRIHSVTFQKIEVLVSTCMFLWVLLHFGKSMLPDTCTTLKFHDVHWSAVPSSQSCHNTSLESNAKQIHTCVRLLELLLISEAEEGVSGRLCWAAAAAAAPCWIMLAGYTPHGAAATP
jgi:hypothetical protein